MYPRCRITLFGNLEVRVDGEPVRDFTPLGSAVLAYLALNLHRALPREELLAHFWPDDDTEVARHKLRQALHSIRHRFVTSGHDPASVLLTTRTILALNEAAVTTDVAEFESDLAAARASSEPSTRTRYLAHAVSLYRGDLLPGLYQDAFVAESNRLSAMHLDALHDLALSYEQAGDLDNAIAAARKVVAANPLVEAAHLDLMRLLAAKGQPTSVHRQYRELERILGEELGVKPSDATRESVEWLQQNGATPQQRISAAVPDSASQVSPNPSRATARRRQGIPLAATVVVTVSVIFLAALAYIVLKPARRFHAAGMGAPATHQPELPGRSRDLGDALWIAPLAAAHGDKSSEPTAMTIDPAGNIYVTGFVDTDRTDVDYITLKYSPAGQLLWERRYNGPGNDLDRARAIAVDVAGNVYVTGESDGGRGHGTDRLSGLDIATIKYGPGGEQLWVRRYAGTCDGRDAGYHVAVDMAGNVYVAGRSWGGDPADGRTGMDVLLLKYSADGNEVWSRRYPTWIKDVTSGIAMTADSAGSVNLSAEVQSGEKSSADSGATDVMTLKYGTAGNLLWQRRYARPGALRQGASCAALDHSGNLMVAGYVRIPYKDAIGNSRDDFLILRYSADGALQWSQTQSLWACPTRTVGIAVTGRDLIYLVARLSSAGTICSVTLPVHPDGAVGKWARDVQAPAARSSYIVSGICVDSAGMVYTTGEAQFPETGPVSTQELGEPEYMTVEYDPLSGQMRRVLRLRGARPLGDFGTAPNAVAVDPDDNVIVTGQAYTGKGFGIVTVKYRHSLFGGP